MKLQAIPIVCVLSGLTIPAVHAFQPPADDAPPPPRVQVADDAEVRIDVVPNDEAEIRPGFLGISVAEIPDALAAHIDVPAGQGAVVRLVAPGSPAEMAGIQLHDVVLKVNDRVIVDHDQLAAIVGNLNEGDTVKVEILRKGETLEMDVMLGGKPAGALGADAGQMPWNVPMPGLGQGFFDDLPGDHAGRIREMLEQNLRALREPGGLMDDDVFQDAFRGMREQMQQLLEDPQRFAPLDEHRGIGNIQMNANATVRMMDNEGSVEVKVIDGSKEITVRDQDNEIVWLGPWDTDQDRAAAPDDVRERIERLNIDRFHGGNGLRLQLRGDR